MCKLAPLGVAGLTFNREKETYQSLALELSDVFRFKVKSRSDQLIYFGFLSRAEQVDPLLKKTDRVSRKPRISWLYTVRTTRLIVTAKTENECQYSAISCALFNLLVIDLVLPR